MKKEIIINIIRLFTMVLLLAGAAHLMGHDLKMMGGCILLMFAFKAGDKHVGEFGE